MLNPRISPDGCHVMYTTGEHLNLIDIADWPAPGQAAQSPSPRYLPTAYATATWRRSAPHTVVGLAEFVAGERWINFDGFLSGRRIPVRARPSMPHRADMAHLRPANPTMGTAARRYPQRGVQRRRASDTAGAQRCDADGCCYGECRTRWSGTETLQVSGIRGGRKGTIRSVSTGPTAAQRSGADRPASAIRSCRSSLGSRNSPTRAALRSKPSPSRFPNMRRAKSG